MPELPEVETTVRGLQKILPGRTIKAVWTDYNSSFHAGKNNIKNPDFFAKFKKLVIGQKVIGASRRAKNVLIHLSGGKASASKTPVSNASSGKTKTSVSKTLGGKTILIHMKMTGHLLYGKYERATPKARKAENNGTFKEARGWEHESWVPDPANAKAVPGLLDPFNKFIHFVLTFDNGKQLAFSDMRKFAKITLIDTDALDESTDLAKLGPEPLELDFTFAHFKERLAKRPNGLIKQVLMDQSIIAGVGNIYSDEILWYADVHPKSRTGKIPNRLLKKIYEEMHVILKRSISLGGDSMSDFRNLAGEKGGFHPYHAAYLQHGKPCGRPACAKIFRQSGGKRGVIVKMRIGDRSAHFCPIHQKLF